MSELHNISPEVLSEQQDDNSVVLSLRIPESLDYFKGHFPNSPILPGVVQLHWAVKYAQEKLSLASSDVKNVEVLKFKVVIIPGQILTLSLTKKTPYKFVFSYNSVKGLHASGRVILSEKVSSDELAIKQVVSLNCQENNV